MFSRSLAPASAVAAFLFAHNSMADEVIIEQPGDHTAYIFEAEPHVLLDPFDEVLPGVGFRGTLELVDNGFIPTINNTVGLGFGVDVTRHTVRIPVVMQWNFFLSNRWSVFGEPGAAIIVHEGRNKDHAALDHFAFYAGGRWHFSERMTLTMRLGQPSFSVGLSFLL